MSLVESILGGGLLANIVAVAFAAGLLVGEQRSQRRELERVEKAAKAEIERIDRDSKERDSAIDKSARERITDGDGSRDGRLEKLESRVERMEERIGEKFDHLAKEIRDVVTALSGRVAELTKRSDPRIQAQRGSGSSPGRRSGMDQG